MFKSIKVSRQQMNLVQTCTKAMRKKSFLLAHKLLLNHLISAVILIKLDIFVCLSVQIFFSHTFPELEKVFLSKVCLS